VTGNRGAPVEIDEPLWSGGTKPRGGGLAAVKIIELIGTSSSSSDDAVQQALNEARTSLRNIKAVDVVSTGLRGDNLDEWRAHVRIAFLVERVSE
jgi:dodecin